MKVAFWNRLWNAKIERQLDYLRSGTLEWDVLLLAECSETAFTRFVDGLGCSDAVSGLDLRKVDDMKRPHGAAVLVRSGLTINSANLIDNGDSDIENCPRPERALAAQITGAGEPLQVVAWHAPYAAGSLKNRGCKRRAYVQMTDWVCAQSGPLVLGMDGNNWLEPEGQPDSDENDPFHAEHRFHGVKTSHGLVDSLRSVRPAEQIAAAANASLAPTYFKTDVAHRMDRIYLSPAIMVSAAGVDYDGEDPKNLAGRRDVCAGSDHALVWADLTDPISGI